MTIRRANGRLLSFEQVLHRDPARSGRALGMSGTPDTRAVRGAFLALNPQRCGRNITK